MQYVDVRTRKHLILPALVALALFWGATASAMFINGHISGGFGYLPAAAPYCPYPMGVAAGSQHPKDKVDHLQDRYDRLDEQLTAKEKARQKVQKEQEELLEQLENHFNFPFSALISEHVVHEGNCCEFTNAEQGYADASSWREGLGVIAALVRNPAPSRGLASLDDGGGGYTPSWHYTSSGTLANFRNSRVYNCDAIARLSPQQLTPDRFGWYYFMGNCPQREIGKYQGLTQPAGTPPPPEQLEAHRARCFNVLTDSRGAWSEEGLSVYKNAVNGGRGRTLAQAGFVEYYFSQCPQILNGSRIVNVDGQYQVVPSAATTYGQTVADFVRERDTEFALQRFLAEGLSEGEARSKAEAYAGQYAGNSLIGPGTPARHREETAGATTSASATDGVAESSSRAQQELNAYQNHLEQLRQRGQQQAQSNSANAETAGSGDSSTDERNPIGNVFRNFMGLLQNAAQRISQGRPSPELTASSSSESQEESSGEGESQGGTEQEVAITIEPPNVTASVVTEESQPASEVADSDNQEEAAVSETASVGSPAAARVILGTCRENTIPLPDGAEGYRADWKQFCRDGGSLATGICRHGAFSSKARDSASVRSCERALARLPQLNQRVAEMTESIDELRDRMSELSFAITDAELERDEMEADCPDGTCTDERFVSGGTDWARILGIAGVVGLGIYDIHSYTQASKYRADLNARLGWPSMAGFGYPAASMGIYGAVLGGLASGTFGCSGGLMGGGLPNMGMYGGGMYGFGMPGMGMGGMPGFGMGGGMGGMMGMPGFGMGGMMGMPGFGMGGMMGMPGFGMGAGGFIGGGLYMNPFMSPYYNGFYPPYSNDGGDSDRPGREAL